MAIAIIYDHNSNTGACKNQTKDTIRLICSNKEKFHHNRYADTFIKILQFIFTRDSRMLRASLPSSGRLSVTLMICIKTVQPRITKSSPWAAPRSLVYHDKISCHWVQGFPSNEGVKEGYPLQKTSFCRYWLE